MGWDLCNISILYLNRSLSGYADYKEKMVVRPSYLYNGNSYTGKTASLYQDGTLVI